MISFDIIGLSVRGTEQLLPLLRKEERRLRKWKNRREDILLARIAEYGQESERAKQLHPLQ